jgi:hypothetical protein
VPRPSRKPIDRFAGGRFELDDRRAAVADVAGDRRAWRQQQRQRLPLSDAGPTLPAPARCRPRPVRAASGIAKPTGASVGAARLEGRARRERLQQRRCLLLFALAPEAARFASRSTCAAARRGSMSRQLRELEAARQLALAPVSEGSPP